MRKTQEQTEKEPNVNKRSHPNSWRQEPEQWSKNKNKQRQIAVRCRMLSNETRPSHPAKKKLMRNGNHLHRKHLKDTRTLFEVRDASCFVRHFEFSKWHTTDYKLDQVSRLELSYLKNREVTRFNFQHKRGEVDEKETQLVHREVSSNGWPSCILNFGTDKIFGRRDGGNMIDARWSARFHLVAAPGLGKKTPRAAVEFCAITLRHSPLPPPRPHAPSQKKYYLPALPTSRAATITISRFANYLFPETY